MSSIDDKKKAEDYLWKIFKKINNIKKKELYFQIYQVILDEKEPHNVNMNGVFFDLKKISSNSINKIDSILLNDDVSTEENNTYNTYSNDEIDKKITSLNQYSKLNNTEKNLIKNINN